MSVGGREMFALLASNHAFPSARAQPHDMINIKVIESVNFLIEVSPVIKIIKRVVVTFNV
jgi:hypothetical protein